MMKFHVVAVLLRRRHMALRALVCRFTITAPADAVRDEHAANVRTGQVHRVRAGSPTVGARAYVAPPARRERAADSMGDRGWPLSAN